MRAAFFLLLLSILTFTSARAADVEFVRVWPGWRSAESFERIAEYFTNQENPGREVIVRTQKDSRTGFYYLVRVMNRGTDLSRAQFTLQIVTPASADIKTYTFPVTLPAKQTVFELGLTGTDWAGEDVHPVAWKLDLLAADGQVLASEQNFLWEKPAAK
jgi:hypothetical protein